MSFAALFLTVGDAGVGGFFYAKFVGLTAGLTFSATFTTAMLVAVVLSRRFLVAQLRKWTDAAVRTHRLETGSLEYIVAMYAKPLRRE